MSYTYAWNAHFEQSVYLEQSVIIVHAFWRCKCECVLGLADCISSEM